MRAPSWWGVPAATIVADAAVALGAIALAGEAAVHVQQYSSLVHGTRIGPLFLANAVACIAVIAALAYPRTRSLASLAGIVVSALALAGLVVSYGREDGLLGWREAGFRTAIVLAVITELAAVILLAIALAASTAALRSAVVEGRRHTVRAALLASDPPTAVHAGASGPEEGEPHEDDRGLWMFEHFPPHKGRP